MIRTKVGIKVDQNSNQITSCISKVHEGNIQENFTSVCANFPDENVGEDDENRPDDRESTGGAGNGTYARIHTS